MLGYTAEELQTKTFADITPPGHVNTDLAEDQEALSPALYPVTERISDISGRMVARCGEH